MIKFDLTYNTPSDWVKAGFTTAAAVLTTLSGVLPDGLSIQEIITLISTAIMTFGTALGIYSDRQKEDS